MSTKRSEPFVLGGHPVHPKLRDPRLDVAGGSPLRSPRIDVASFRQALDDPFGTAEDEARLLADFADFMVADLEAAEDPRTRPDPAFRERLRKRLWRAHVMSRARDDGRNGMH